MTTVETMAGELSFAEAVRIITLASEPELILEPDQTAPEIGADLLEAARMRCAMFESGLAASA